MIFSEISFKYKVVAFIMVIYNKRHRNFLLISMAVILIFSVIQITLLKNYVILPSEDNPAYALPKNTYTKIFSAAVVVIIAIFALFSFGLMYKKQKQKVGYNDSPTIFFAALIGFMSLSSAALLVYHSITNKIYCPPLDAAVIAAAFVMSFYFFYTSSRAPKHGNMTYIILSFIPIVYTILRVFWVFIPVRETVVDITVLFRLFGLAFTMLFFVAELKSVNGTPNRNASTFFGLSAIFLNLLFQIPDLTLSAFWLFGFSTKSVLTAVDLFISLFIFARLIAMTEKQETSDETEEIDFNR